MQSVININFNYWAILITGHVTHQWAIAYIMYAKIILVKCFYFDMNILKNADLAKHA